MDIFKTILVRDVNTFWEAIVNFSNREDFINLCMRLLYHTKLGKLII